MTEALRMGVRRLAIEFGQSFGLFEFSMHRV